MSLKKGIKGRLKLPCKEGTVDIIKANADAFLDVVETEFTCCEYDIYEAEYNNEDVVIIDYNIMAHTTATCKSELSHFKKEIKRFFREKPENIISMTYDKI